MAVTLRLVRMGRRNRSFFRLRVSDSRFAPGGRFIEELGHLDPLEKSRDKQFVCKKDRVEYWLGRGAVASQTVAELLKKQGITAREK